MLGTSFAISGVPGLVMTIFAAVGGAGGLYAWFKKGWAKDTIYILQQQNSAQQQEIDNLKTASAAKDTEIASLRNTLDVLKDNITQSTKVDMLATTMDSQHRAQLMRMEQQTTLLINLVKMVAKQINSPVPPEVSSIESEMKGVT